MKLPFVIKDKQIQPNFDYLTRLLNFIFTVSPFAIRFGVDTITWAGALATSDFPAIIHGVVDQKGTAKLPRVVLATPASGITGGKFVVVTAFNYTTTTFNLQGVSDDRSIPAAGTTCPIAWMAVG
jgi:hypothetical protein